MNIQIFATTLLLVAITVYTEAFLFGVSITDAAGAVLGATNPTQTAALAGAGLLTAATGLAIGSALSNANRPTSTRTVRAI